MNPLTGNISRIQILQHLASEFRPSCPEAISADRPAWILLRQGQAFKPAFDEVSAGKHPTPVSLELMQAGMHSCFC